MSPKSTLFAAISLFFLFTLIIPGCNLSTEKLVFDTEEDEPWVIWYWMYASVSKEGITADLEAMKEAGIGGAFMMPILGKLDPPPFEPVAEQLSPLWWEMVAHSIQEADRLGLRLGIHVTDGFAVAGGPWIKPEQSMQKVVWSETVVKGGKMFWDSLSQPPTLENYYKDIAVFAVPNRAGTPLSSFDLNPKVTSQTGDDVAYIGKKQTAIKFKSDDPVWIQFEFNEPFTCRVVKPYGPSSNLQWQRFKVLASQDGENFEEVAELKPARQGWQNWDEGSTFSIPATTAKYFRFAYDKAGTEPGSEDLDAGKWKAKLVVQNIELLSSPKVHQIEGKSALVWRISDWTDSTQVPNSLCPQLDEVVNLTKSIDENGILNWDVPEGSWTILRMGHTSTGHTNYTGGGALGLECDKFSKEAVQLQFNNWFGAIKEKAGPELATRVISMLHVDSWECGSQNWTGQFAQEFLQRRGYDLTPYLPILAGFPLESSEKAERFLHDFRETISELYVENFYEVLSDLARQNGVGFSVENVSPTMLSDGMKHFSEATVPTGEFWLRSPTHDKPNDMLDALSGGHIYGKTIIAAEAFTQLRMDWDEHPAALKTLGDYQYTQGVNKFFYHVFAHNPWLDKKPGMTLNGVGLYFQRDQTWWKQGRAMIDYATRCQALLQNGYPVVDIAVFTGEELPRRSVLPDRLVNILPGLVDPELIEREKERLANEGAPTMKQPADVTLSANMAVNYSWVDFLNGYKYDSFNPHALLDLARVENERVVFGDRTSYALLVIPATTLMNPEGQRMSVPVARKLLDLINQGAIVYFQGEYDETLSLNGDDQELQEIMSQILGEKFGRIADQLQEKELGAGRVLKGVFDAKSLSSVGANRDIKIADSEGNTLNDIAWTHRAGETFDFYFISNQKAEARTVDVTVRITGREPELYDPVNDELITARVWDGARGHTKIPIQLAENGSMFIILRHNTPAKGRDKGLNWRVLSDVKEISGEWNVQFDEKNLGPKEPQVFSELADWTTKEDFNIRHFSGTAIYNRKLNLSIKSGKRYWIDLGEVANIAEVTLNGVNCGIVWTSPYQLEITDAVKKGANDLVIEVTNTWKNRLMGDHELPDSLRLTSAPRVPYLLEGRPLAKSGLLGPVKLLTEE